MKRIAQLVSVSMLLAGCGQGLTLDLDDQRRAGGAGDVVVFQGALVTTGPFAGEYEIVVDHQAALKDCTIGLDSGDGAPSLIADTSASEDGAVPIFVHATVEDFLDPVEIGGEADCNIVATRIDDGAVTVSTVASVELGGT